MRLPMVVAALLLCGGAAAQDLNSAAVASERLVKEQPTAANWQKLGLARYLQNQFEAATRAFAEALKLDPTLWPSHLFLGVSRYRLNDFRAALKSLKEADRLAPPDAQGRDDVDYWVGATHIALRAPLPGLSALEKLLARSPSHVAALQLATETYAETASNLWNRIAEQHFQSSAGQEVHGYALESDGNTAGALTAFREASRLAPRRSGPRVAAARLLLRTGSLDDAATALDTELALDPASPEALWYTGLLAIRQNRFSDAVIPLSRAADWMPGNEEPLLALAQVWLSLKQSEKAVSAARRALSLDGRSIAAHELLLAALTAAGDEAGASAERQRWQRQQ